MRDAAVSRARSGGIDARDAGDRRHRGRAGQVQPDELLADRRSARRHLVFGGADDSPAAAGAREEGSPKPAGAGKLRFIRSCSASLPPQVLHDLEAAFGAPVLEAYGMTEAAHQMSSNPLPAQGPHLPGSVGPGTDVQITIADDKGNHLKPHERGEVCIKGPNVITGYENNPEANATSFFDGWFRTGDQGFLDENGYLTLVGRLKELINRGGEKISPREIDEVLLDASGGRRGGVLRRAAQDVGRGSRSGGHAEGHDQRGRPARVSARRSCRTSSARSRSTSPRRFRARPRARSSVASSRRRSRPKRRCESSSPAPARSAATSARGWRRPAPMSCCSRAARISRRCRSAACA